VDEDAGLRHSSILAVLRHVNKYGRISSINEAVRVFERAEKNIDTG
jgi:hypothetical protein